MPIDIALRDDAKVITTDRGNYWRYYGLHRDPFAPHMRNSEFCLLHRWEQYFDLIQYLCHSSNVLLAMAASKGSGKTIFKQQFIEHLDSGIHFSELFANPTLDPHKLSALLVKDFQLSPANVDLPIEEQFEFHLLNLQHSEKLCLLIIDDAHRLPEKTVKILLSLVRQQSEAQMRLHIFLLGAPQLKEMLLSLAEPNSAEELVHHLELEPFNLDETQHYIKYRLITAGLPAGLPLSQTSIARIHELSEGIPGRINAVARQALIDSMRQPKLHEAVNFMQTRRIQLLGGGVLLLLVVMCALLLMRGNHDSQLSALKIYMPSFKKAQPVVAAAPTQPGRINSSAVFVANNALERKTASFDIKSKMQTVSAVHTLSMRVKKTLATLVSLISPVKATMVEAQPEIQTPIVIGTPNIIFSTPPVESSVATANETSTVATVEVKEVANSVVAELSNTPVSAATDTATIETKELSNPIVAQISESPAAAINTATIEAKEVKHTTVAQVSVVPVATAEKELATSENTANAVPVKTKKLAAAPRQRHAIVGQHNLVAATPQHFTIQLIGVGSETALQKFIARHELMNQVTYFRSNRQGKSWYSLVYGDYATVEEAQAAIQQLPKPLQALHPWVRTFASVQKQVG